ncbi:hemocyte protein-glutamine gamma-glutamyltransferase-like [Mya arenaria]|uniref:hemocyte protein-glutamine gamma-glutamyltransferase-like n=1 Tax=Mya arenaria TaxID=6604 RepID=UPI0022E8E2B4|nr:hemocyte protein-glutamine gamma-glutamyltransferase-like [Mya arenaria]XP_052818914.1 hemocyte protein-glutamine gamma-glutamyltransferase-like [Mya arenaria]
MPGTGNAPRASDVGRRVPMEVDTELFSDFEMRTLFGSDVLVHSSDPRDEVIEDPNILHVKAVDLDIKNNTKAHRTDEFDIADASVYDDREFLVVRRGQAFKANITFSKEFDPSEDDLRLIFQFGKYPLASSGSYVELVLSDKDVKSEWGAWMESREEKVTSIQVVTPPTVYVGKWTLSVDIIKRKDAKITIYRYKHEKPIYVLFNPWCKEDGVYMPDKDGSQIGEYVLNDTGKIYAGNTRSISPKPWVFGQFTGNVLDCILNLLDTEMNVKKRGDPVMVSRKLSALVNSSNEDGILTGNWSGDYTGGTSPLDWTGSVAIFEQYYETNAPVEYGQCWVFSGILTTACRALGIPARSVTNFASAHDTDGSITIDEHYDSDGEPMAHLNGDSCWNFHVWNDVWMARPDLQAGYGGWQAIDATPQEESIYGGSRSYCMGPMSLRAIREGRVNFPYDGPFVFAEVNADRVTWKKNKDTANFEIVDITKSSVGRYLSTKGVKGMTFERTWFEKLICSDEEREDVTCQYKFKEGSEEERAAVREASMHSSETTKKTKVYEPAVKDVEFKVSADPNTFVGDDIEVTLVMENKSDSTRTVSGTLVIGTTFYTGVFHKELLKKKFQGVQVEGLKEEKFRVPVKEYLDKLADHFMISISFVCVVQETRQHFVDSSELRLRKPHLTVKAPDKARVDKSFQVNVSFVNPLPVSLTKCELRVEGPGLLKPICFQQPDLKEKSTFTATFEMTPVKTGQRDIIVYYNSQEISAITGTHSVNVEF